MCENEDAGKLPRKAASIKGFGIAGMQNIYNTLQIHFYSINHCTTIVQLHYTYDSVIT